MKSATRTQNKPYYVDLDERIISLRDCLILALSEIDSQASYDAALNPFPPDEAEEPDTTYYEETKRYQAAIAALNALLPVSNYIRVKEVDKSS